MAIFNGNRVFSSKKTKSMPIVKCPKNVRQALNIDEVYRLGSFKLEPKKKQAMYDRTYLFEDINYINKNVGEQRIFLTELMAWLNSINVEFKITLANEYQNLDELLEKIRSEKNKEQYPEIAEGMRQWREWRLEETNPNVTTMRYLTVTSRADNKKSAEIYLNALETTVEDAFESWGSRIIRLDGMERLKVLHSLIQPGRKDEQDMISEPGSKKDWKNDIMPRSIETYKNFMIMGDTYVSVLFGWKYRKTIDSDTFIQSLANVPYPSFLTLDFAPVETDVVSDKLAAVQVNNDRNITDELEQKRKAGQPAVLPSYAKTKRKEEIEGYINQVDENDEQGFFMNLLAVITADNENTLAERINEMQAVARKEGCTMETCDFNQLKAWNTALPIGGRQVDYMRFFLTSSLVAFQPYHAQDVIEPGGQMMGINKTTRRFIIANRKKLPNPHGIIIGYSGSGKSMLIKLTELSQTLLSTDDDIVLLDPQNEFKREIELWGGTYFDLTPKSGIYLNGFEVTEEVFKADETIKREFVASQTEYAKTLCAAVMKNINVTQEHDAVISRCTERMYEKIFRQRRLRKQPTLLMLREEISQELVKVSNEHDEKIIRPIFNCLEEYTVGSCDMLSKPTNIKTTNKRLSGFGLANVPENNWEAVMVTILHYLSVRMDYNKKYQRATHLIVDETQVISKKPGSAAQLNNAVLTFRKFGGIVTMAMQNVTAALANPLLVELFSNCAYKCFLDQGGVDAKSLAQIQELSEKEYRALGSGKEGQGVMVWNKKVVLFDAKIRKDNVLYETFSTNYHEKAEQQSRSGKKIEEQGKEILEGAEEQNDPEGMYESTVLRLAALSAVSVQDITEILSISREESRQLLTRMTETGQLVEIASDQEERYKKAV